MESIDREQFNIGSRVLINIEIVNKCISDLDNYKIEDRQKFYTKCVLDRFNRCNKIYVKDFDDSLNKLSDNLFNSEGEFNYREFRRLLKASTKLTSNVYDKCIDLICSLNKE